MAVPPKQLEPKVILGAEALRPKPKPKPKQFLVYTLPEREIFH